jgi:hypothetical protein
MDMKGGYGRQPFWVEGLKMRGVVIGVDSEVGGEICLAAERILTWTARQIWSISSGKGFFLWNIANISVCYSLLTHTLSKYW